MYFYLTSSSKIMKRRCAVSYCGLGTKHQAIIMSSFVLLEIMLILIEIFKLFLVIFWTHKIKQNIVYFLIRKKIITMHKIQN